MEQNNLSDNNIEILTKETNDNLFELHMSAITWESIKSNYKNQRQKIVKNINDLKKQGHTSEQIQEIFNQFDITNKTNYSKVFFTNSEFLIQERLSTLLKWNDIINLDIKIEYLVEGLIPKGSITLLFGRGGIGKTTVALQMAKAVAEGIPFGNVQTLKTSVYYVDFENPLPVLKERAVNIGQADNFWVWHISNTPMPPRLDGKDWELYKQLPPGLIVFDTLRAAHSSDENDSQHMAIIIARLKELRELGFTILLLHHTPKGNENIYKGSTALLDLVDHVLGFENVKGTEGEPIEFDADNLYRLGARIKTRYEPNRIFLKFKPEIKSFEIATDPEIETLESIYTLLKDKAEPLNTNQAYELIKKELDINSKSQVIRLLKKGTDRYWRADKRGRAVFYSPIVQPIYTQTIRPMGEKPENTQEPVSKENSPQTHINTVKSNSLRGSQTDRPMDKISTIQAGLWDEIKNNAGNGSKGSGKDVVI